MSAISGDPTDPSTLAAGVVGIAVEVVAGELCVLVIETVAAGQACALISDHLGIESGSWSIPPVPVAAAHASAAAATAAAPFPHTEPAATWHGWAMIRSLAMCHTAT